MTPEKFMLYETWFDLDDVLDVQIHRPYRQTYWTRLPSLLAETQKIETWYPIRTDMPKAAAESLMPAHADWQVPLRETR